MTHPVLELLNVSKTYTIKQGLFGEYKPLHALQDVTFSLKKGEVIGLVGESGCGKTTLANILLGLRRPTSGQVLISGQQMHNVSLRQRANLVQPVFQDPYESLNPRKTVAQIVGLPLVLLRIHRNEIKRRVLELLNLVGLPQRSAGSYPSQMSGGQRQRVAIARALIAKPKVLICDEPTSALDVSVQSQILNLLQDLRSELGLTYLLISHNLSVVRHMSDRVVVMYLGKIIEEGLTEAIYNAPQHPYTRALLQSALPPVPGQGLPEISISGDFPNPINPPSGCAFHPRCPIAVDQCREQYPKLLGINNRRTACFLAGDI